MTLVDSGAVTLRGGDGTSASGALTLTSNVNTSAGIIQLALGATGTDHSSLIQSAGTWTFGSMQLFNFIDLGVDISEGTVPISASSPDWLLIPPLRARGPFRIPGWSGTFVYNGGDIDFTLDTLAPVPEPSTWIAGALAVGVVGWSVLKKRKAETLKT